HLMAASNVTKVGTLLEGIDIDTPSQWVIEGLKDAGPFFDHLSILVPADSTLYIEGTTIVSEVANLYAAHRDYSPVAVILDTIWPEPAIYHVIFSPELTAGMRQLLEKHSVEEMFDHIKGYKNKTLLFTFHDAFEGSMRVSEHVPEAAVAAFCQPLGVSYRRQK